MEGHIPDLFKLIDENEIKGVNRLLQDHPKQANGWDENGSPAVLQATKLKHFKICGNFIRLWGRRRRTLTPLVYLLCHSLTTLHHSPPVPPALIGAKGRLYYCSECKGRDSVLFILLQSDRSESDRLLTSLASQVTCPAHPTLA